MRIAPFALLMTLLAASACEKERNVVSSENDSGVSLAISIDSRHTRSILEDEGIDSGFYMMIYRSDSGEFVDCISFESRSGGELILRKGEVYDMYVLGNMWYVDADGGRRTLKDIGVTSVSDYTYRFDGGVDAGGTHRENFSEIVRYGIPYSGMVKRVKAEEGATVNVSCSFLFAKLSVTVDHSGLVNGSVSEDVFRNSKLHVRGANSVVKPFASSSVKAESASDLLETSDYSSTMENGGSLTFTYYVPENAQGSDDNVTDPSQKTTATKALATYIEFETVVDGTDETAGGYGGTVTYQFCPGANATTDFNVLRNTQYNVTLSFKAGSLFSPSWKVSVDDWSDTRTIRLSADNAGSSESLLKDDGTQILAVRKNRPAQCYVYFNRSGAAGSNERATYLDYLTTAQVASYNPSNVSRSGYSLVYDSTVLSQYGMSLSYDSSIGKITVSYNSASAGAANFLNVNTQTSGIPVTVTLYPGGKTVKALVKTYENLAVTVTSGDRYVGMKTNVKASGFVGSNVKVSASNGSVTPGVFRTSNSAASDGSEGTDNYLGSTPVAVPSGTGLDLYAYRNAASLTLSCTSEDSFNDGTQSTTLTVYKPTFTLISTEYDLAIDGTEVPVPVSYKDRSGNVMQESSFDAEVYAQLMKPVITKAAQTISDFTYVSIDDAAATPNLYISDIPGSTTKPTSRTKMGTISVSGRNGSLFPAKTGTVYYRYPRLQTPFSDIKSGCINTDALPHLTNTAQIDPAGCTSCFSTCDDWYNVATGTDGTIKHQSCSLTSAGKLTWDWSITDEDALLLFGYQSVTLPYGKRTFNISIANKHSGREHTISNISFDISYSTAEIHRVVLYRLDDFYSYCYLCTAMSAAIFKKWIDAEYTKTTYTEPPKVNGIAPYIAYYQHDEIYYQGEGVQYYYTTCRTSMSSRYAQWYLDHEYPWDIHGYDRPSDYTTKWSQSLVYDAENRMAGYPFGAYFYYNGELRATLRQEMYPAEDRPLLLSCFPFHINPEPALLMSDESFFHWYMCSYMDVR